MQKIVAIIGTIISFVLGLFCIGQSSRGRNDKKSGGNESEIRKNIADAGLTIEQRREQIKRGLEEARNARRLIGVDADREREAIDREREDSALVAESRNLRERAKDFLASQGK